ALEPSGFSSTRSQKFCDCRPAYCLFIVGYRYLERMSWIDAFANASMILSGMGPLTPLESPGGKLFAGFYPLYSGLALIMTTGTLFAPPLHRLMHQFDLEEKGKQTV